MFGLLLDATPAVNGGELVFGIKDVITLVLGILGVSTTFLTLQLNFNSHKEATKVKFDTIKKENDSKTETIEKDFEKEIKSVREELISVKSSKRAQKAEFMEIIKEKDAATRARIDKAQGDIKELTNSTNDEFKSINTNISDIKSGNARIEGMLSQILNKN
jgi:hypothetical protein